MNTNYESIQGSINACINYLKEDDSLIQNFIDIEVLEEYWESIALQETDPLEFRKKRQEIEHEILAFTLMVRGIYIGEQKSLEEPDWMKSGHKDRDEFLNIFFRQIKQLDTKFFEHIKSISTKDLSYYQNLYIKWKIARKREIDAPKNIKKKSQQARALKKVLEELIVLEGKTES